MGAGLGVAHGAVSVLNAIGTGIGGAVSVSGLYTRAEAWKHSEVEIQSTIEGQGRIVVSKRIIDAVLEVLSVFGVRGFKAKITSNIPLEAGLKSSSAFINALVAAVLDAHGYNIPAREIASLTSLITLKAGLSVTGAFDDAIATIDHGVFITNNEARSILASYTPPPLEVAISASHGRLHISNVDVSSFKRLAPLYEKAIRLALNGRWLEAATLNGFATMVATRRLDLHDHLKRALVLDEVLSAGVSGKGPALFAIATDTRRLRRLWRGVMTGWLN